jgi:hypothetical protein
MFRLAETETPMPPDRISFTDKGQLDEVVASGGAHLEHMGKDRWFLLFCHEDGTETAIWFGSRDLRKPFWEKRGKQEG